MNVFCEKIGETIAYEEYPDGVRIIPHNKLEDILRRYSARFIIEVKPVLISPEMCLVECRATDKETGETVLKVGESNPSNLEPAGNITQAIRSCVRRDVWKDHRQAARRMRMKTSSS